MYTIHTVCCENTYIENMCEPKHLISAKALLCPAGNKHEIDFPHRVILNALAYFPTSNHNNFVELLTLHTEFILVTKGIKTNA